MIYKHLWSFPGQRPLPIDSWCGGGTCLGQYDICPLSLKSQDTCLWLQQKGNFQIPQFGTKMGQVQPVGSGVKNDVFVLSYCEVWNVCHTFVMHVLTDTILIICPWGTELSLASYLFYDNSWSLVLIVFPLTPIHPLESLPFSLSLSCLVPTTRFLICSLPAVWSHRQPSPAWCPEPSSLWSVLFQHHSGSSLCVVQCSQRQCSYIQVSPNAASCDDITTLLWPLYLCVL